MPLDDANGTPKRRGANLVLRNVIISFPTLFEARQVLGEGKPVFSAVFLLDPNTQRDQIQNLVKLCSEVADGYWKNGSWKEMRKSPDPRAFWWPIRKGDDFPNRRGYPGRIFISARSSERPGVVDQNVQPVLDASRVYAGMIVNAGISLYPYANLGKGIGCGLNNVQLVRDGERFTGRPSATDEFQAIPVESYSGDGPSKMTGLEEWMN